MNGELTAVIGCLKRLGATSGAAAWGRLQSGNPEFLNRLQNRENRATKNRAGQGSSRWAGLSHTDAMKKQVTAFTRHESGTGGVEDIPGKEYFNYPWKDAEEVYEKAVEILQRYLNVNPSFPVAWHRLKSEFPNVVLALQRCTALWQHGDVYGED